MNDPLPSGNQTWQSKTHHLVPWFSNGNPPTIVDAQPASLRDKPNSYSPRPRRSNSKRTGFLKRWKAPKFSGTKSKVSVPLLYSRKHFSFVSTVLLDYHQMLDLVPMEKNMLLLLKKKKHLFPWSATVHLFENLETSGFTQQKSGDSIGLRDATSKRFQALYLLCTRTKIKAYLVVHPTNSVHPSG